MFEIYSSSFIFRLYTTGGSSILVFAPEDLFQICSELRDINSGVVLTSDGVAPFYFQTKDGGAPICTKFHYLSICGACLCRKVIFMNVTISS